MQEAEDLLGLLDGVPTEEFSNPNIGEFPEAVLQDAQVVVKKSGAHSVKLTFDDKGRKRLAEFQLPEPESHPIVGKKSLDWQRALGIVEQSSKRGYIVRGETTEDRYGVASQIVNAIKTVAVGHTIPYKTTERGDFEDHVPMRVNK